jgi:hypothetical protein
MPSRFGTAFGSELPAGRLHGGGLLGLGEVNLAGIRRQRLCTLQSAMGQFEPLGATVVAGVVNRSVKFDQQTPGPQKLRITLHGFIEQAYCLGQFVPILQIFLVYGPCTQVQVVSLEVGSGRGFDGALFLGREPRLELVGDGLGNVALEGKRILQRAVVVLGPWRGVRARVDELGVDAHALAVVLHAALDQVGDFELTGDLAQIARLASLEPGLRRRRGGPAGPDPAPTLLRVLR